VFHGTISQNGQVTVKNSTRKSIGIEPGDLIFFTITRVIDSDGRIRYDMEKEERGYSKQEEEKWEQ